MNSLARGKDDLYGCQPFTFHSSTAVIWLFCQNVYNQNKYFIKMQL